MKLVLRRQKKERKEKKENPIKPNDNMLKKETQNEKQINYRPGLVSNPINGTSSMMRVRLLMKPRKVIYFPTLTGKVEELTYCKLRCSHPYHQYLNLWADLYIFYYQVFFFFKTRMNPDVSCSSSTSALKPIFPLNKHMEIFIQWKY